MHWLAGGGPELLQGPLQGLQAATEQLGAQLRAAGTQVQDLPAGPTSQTSVPADQLVYNIRNMFCMLYIALEMSAAGTESCIIWSSL